MTARKNARWCRICSAAERQKGPMTEGTGGVGGFCILHSKKKREWRFGWEIRAPFQSKLVSLLSFGSGQLFLPFPIPLTASFQLILLFLFLFSLFHSLFYSSVIHSRMCLCAFSVIIPSLSSVYSVPFHLCIMSTFRFLHSLQKKYCVFQSFNNRFFLPFNAMQFTSHACFLLRLLSFLWGGNQYRCVNQHSARFCA